MTIVLIIIILIVSLSLNIASWCFLCRYNRASKPEALELIKRRSNPERTAATVSPNRSSSTNSSISHSIAISRAKSAAGAKQKPPNPYHLVLIAVNIIDLPFYISFLVDYFEPSLSNKHILIRIVSVSQILGHSINVMVYLLFHKRFRVMFSKPFCMVL